MKNTTTLFVFLFGILSLTYSQTLKIGTQVWTTKNLDVSTFRNGDPIPQAKTEQEWEFAGKNKQPAWCYYENNEANGLIYGKLYNWYAVNDARGLAPVGFHVPSDEEWMKLIDYLGGFQVAQNKMKSKNGWKNYLSSTSKKCPKCASWNAEYRKKVACHTCKDTRRTKGTLVVKSGNGLNTSGFSALPGGSRAGYGSFNGSTSSGYWWSVTEDDIDYSNEFHILSDFEFSSKGRTTKSDGISVRCIKD